MSPLTAPRGGALAATVAAATTVTGSKRSNVGLLGPAQYIQTTELNVRHEWSPWLMCGCAILYIYMTVMPYMIVISRPPVPIVAS